jgi:hypothetical protein
MTVTKESASLIRKYIYEVALIVLFGAVIKLTALYLDLNSYVRNEMVKQNLEVVKQLTENTNALNNFNNNLKIQK